MALEKAIIANTVTGERIPVLFNPEEYTIQRGMNWATVAVPGLSAPILQFVSGGQQVLEMELFLDTREGHKEGSRQVVQPQEDVRRLTRMVTDLMEIEPTTHAPPVLLFTWASLAFSCVLARCTQRFTMFLPSGVPVRARVGVTFAEFRNAELEAKEVKRETADFTKHRVVGQGQSLHGLAAAEYGDPRRWRVIAARNGVETPRRVAAGTALVLPRLPWRDPLTGKVTG
jgi:nucleoid-associated protein YgaU